MGKEFGTEAVFGKPGITSAKTGEPIDNPAHGIPVIGSLFSLGMDLGNRYDPTAPISWPWEWNWNPIDNIQQEPDI